MVTKDLSLKLSKCHRCYLSEHRHNVVIGRGASPADVLFIGEAPGGSEDIIGIPFVGKSGRLLDEMLTEAHSNISFNTRTFLTNTVLCRPCDSVNGENREPTKGEMGECLDNVLLIVREVNPKVVVFVGDIARRQFKKYFKMIPQFHIYHPSFLLREGGKSSTRYHHNVKVITDAYEMLKEREDRFNG